MIPSVQPQIVPSHQRATRLDKIKNFHAEVRSGPVSAMLDFPVSQWDTLFEPTFPISTLQGLP